MTRQLTQTAIAIIAMLFCNYPGSASPTYYLTVFDSTKIVSILPSGGNVAVTFSQTNLNAIVSGYTIKRFERAYGNSRFPHLRNVWKITADSALAIVTQLKAANSYIFPSYRIYQEPVSLGTYTPADWQDWSGDGYLEYINARQAWGETHGDPSIVIGVGEPEFDISNPDLVNKVVFQSSLTQGASVSSHGTRVAGLIAGETDNDGTYPSIGFNCKLHLDTRGSDVEKKMAKDYRIRIINGSYGAAVLYNPLEDDAYNDIYEEGAFMVASAGNGPDKDNAGNPIPPLADEKYYPASYDNVFSVTSIGWENTTGNSYRKDFHDINTGDHVFVHQYNDRVDLMAPGHHIGGLRRGAPWYVNGTSAFDDGSSFAAPIVSGTAGLMLSANPCLSVYQLEYLLKKYSNTGVLSIPENQFYANKLGAGSLNAGATVAAAKGFDCNDQATKTLFIKGVEITTLCAPGIAANGATPHLNAIVENGSGTLTYRWEAMDNNTCTLSAYDIANPEITASSPTPGSNGEHVARFRLVVTDQSTYHKVARRIFVIKLRTELKSDLSVRDSYMDMLNEPNDMIALSGGRDWQMWQSPDLWMRQTADGGLVHEPIEYLMNDPNQVYTRIRNVGCAAYDPNGTANSTAAAQIYWTKASTGEHWAVDWNGSYTIGGASGQVRVGGLIASIDVPALQSGESVVLGTPWHPEEPQAYLNTPTEVDVCILARIKEIKKRTDMFGNIVLSDAPMTVSEVARTTDNVYNNNNIATRNLIITNTNLSNKPAPRRIVDIANISAQEAYFDLQLITEREINRHFSGDFSVLGNVKLYLGDLYARVAAIASDFPGISFDSSDHSLLWGGNGQLVIPSVLLAPNERTPVGIEFLLNEPKTATAGTHIFHLRQFEAGANREALPYGNVTFQVVIPEPVADSDHPQAKSISPTDHNSHYMIYPTPASGQVYLDRLFEAGSASTVCLMDLQGRRLQSTVMAAGNNRIALGISNLASGLYLVEVTEANGTSERYKIIVK